MNKDNVLISASKRSSGGTAHYVLSTKEGVYDKGNHYIGKLRSNFLGTEFNIFDTGKNPKDTDKKEEHRLNLGSVVYVILYSE